MCQVALFQYSRVQEAVQQVLQVKYFRSSTLGQVLDVTMIDLEVSSRLLSVLVHVATQAAQHISRILHFRDFRGSLNISVSLIKPSDGRKS